MLLATWLRAQEQRVVFKRIHMETFRGIANSFPTSHHVKKTHKLARSVFRPEPGNRQESLYLPVR